MLFCKVKKVWYLKEKLNIFDCKIFLFKEMFNFFSFVKSILNNNLYYYIGINYIVIRKFVY